MVIQSSYSDPPRFSLYRWRELKQLLLKEPSLSLALPIGERRFELAPDQGVTPTVYFRVTEIDSVQRVRVTYNTDDYLYRSIYQVAGNVIQPERLRIGHGMMVLGAVFLGAIATVFLGWLFAAGRQLSKYRFTLASK